MTRELKKRDLHAALTELFAAPPPNERFAAALGAHLRSRAHQLGREWVTKPQEGTWREGFKGFGVKHRSRVFLSGACLLLAIMVASTVVVVGPGQVWAALQQLIGFVPGIGFVNLRETALLAQPTAQIRDGITLVVDEVVAERDQTQLHYHIEGVPSDLAWHMGPEYTGEEEAWLITEEGYRYPVGSVSMSENEGYLGFPALPKGIFLVTLELPRLPLARPGALPQNWRIPLRLEPGMARVAAEKLPTIVYTDAALVRSGVRISIPVVAIGKEVTAVTLVGEVLNRKWSMFKLDSANPVTGEYETYLTDDQGRHYRRSYPAAVPAPMEPQEIRPGERLTQLTETFTFQPLTADLEEVTLHIPAVDVKVPTEVSFEVDIGENPQVGDVFPLDIPLKVADFNVRFERGEIQRDQEGRILLRLTTAPVEPQGDKQLSQLEASAPGSCCLVETGFEVETQRLSVSFELRNDDGSLSTGPQTVFINHAVVTLLGPFELIWPIPSAR
ncbi:MAG TPA: hypothetical protein DCP08_06595 [Chloroflexi bacterium]|nr:hypothetical protein [Chloroflexota bacterium]